ncbi:MFS transporter [Peribacillus cavernae]|uniref:MFS transporter n=1 Tax=Peribacillus cavernae TaxID=1674310 RepID=A0A433HFR5_9BACI|nr:MFS transporter [Peribacillus cavernae]MDQ0219457.1 MFS family permease [Peribacillus cavernae]RUQ27120.1 MFS transporter [Peribacillus cavernae]
MENQAASINSKNYLVIVLFTVFAGVVIDGFEMSLYSFSMKSVSEEFGISISTAALVATVTLIGYATGGFFWGPIADRKGRKFALYFTISMYAVFTLLTAFTWNLTSLMVIRFFAGFAIGGEWAIGAALLSEVWPSKSRGRALAFMAAGWPIGSILASWLFQWIDPSFGWRGVFVAGFIPAALLLISRFLLKEPEHFTEVANIRNESNVENGDQVKQLLAEELNHSPVKLLFTKYIRQFLLLFIISSIGLTGYYTIMTWLPTYLATEKGLNLTSLTYWYTAINFSMFLGYYLFGEIADRLGRRITFTIYFILSVISMPLFAMNDSVSGFAIFIGLVMGFSQGYFSGLAAFGTEIFPTHIRGTGITYSYTAFGRIVATIAPFLVGSLGAIYGLGFIIGVIGFLYVPAIIVIWWLGRETTGVTIKDLDSQVIIGK